MSLSLKILIPRIQVATENVYFIGYIDRNDEDNSMVLYVTKLTQDITAERKFQAENDNILYGCWSSTAEQKLMCKYRNFLIIQHHQKPKIKKLVIDHQIVRSTDDCIFIFYEYKSIKQSEVICDSLDFTKLQQYVHSDCGYLSKSVTNDPVIRHPSWSATSMLFQHLLNSINLALWLGTTIRANNKITIKHGNLILSILVDLALGYLIMEFILQHRADLGYMLIEAIENIVTSLNFLLTWIMGSPAGLKLNNAFNKMLGQYFSYHIQLWGLFLDVVNEKLDTVLYLYQYVGYLGFTIQAAIVSDMICIATFHSYCIYVYAARLFNLQVSGLIALLRLFVGKKYNPLRGGIDSCEYTNQELFVGTVAFTILLLLLPTTLMYYMVFAMFRLLSLAVQYCLSKLIYLVQTLPIYVGLLWLRRSPKVAGSILIEVLDRDESSPLVLRVILLTKSLGDLVQHSRPPVAVPKHVELRSIVSNVFRGKHIV